MRKVLLVTMRLMVALPIAGFVAAGPVLGQPVATAAKPADSNSMEGRLEQRITQMHRRLNITPEQEAAWGTFTQAMRGNATSTEQAYRQRSLAIEGMTAPENLHNFAQIEQARAQGVESLATSFDGLYGTLSNEQKKTADAMFRHFDAQGPGRPHAARKPG